MSSQLEIEARQSPAAVATFLAAESGLIDTLGAQLREQPPASMLTIARGSSDHAAHYFAYLTMARLGRVVASLPMSLVTLHGARLHCDGLAAMAFSQSGQSPDLVAPMQYVSASGGKTIAFVNAVSSPLAQVTKHVIQLHAGEECSVAATKSFIAQLVAGASLVAAWQGDPVLQRAINEIPDALARAARSDWRGAVAPLADASRLYVVGRGTGLAIAAEAALKLKEVCGIQAEAFSGAELQHGPMALIEPGYPVLVLAPRGPAQAGLLQLASDLRSRGALVLVAAPQGTPGAQLTSVASPHEDLDPITMVFSFYPLVAALAEARGLDPDRPRHLAKVTRTV